jgi:hypothetical protein
LTAGSLAGVVLGADVIPDGVAVAGGIDVAEVVVGREAISTPLAGSPA